MTDDAARLQQLAKLVRYYVLVSTTEAGSGHPTSSLSAVELMVALFFGGHFRFDVENVANPNNDRLIFSKGHAAPLLYSLYVAAAGWLGEEELMTLRRFGSLLEGHPTTRFPYCEAATGSLGQGLSVGLGMALNAKYVDRLPYKTYVLLGDSEMAEGSNWEAIQLAAHYRTDNLVGILDVNRLGQSAETMYGHDLEAYERRVAAFGWETILVDGHSVPEIMSAYVRAAEADAPVMIIAKTAKGKGVSLFENKPGWHGKPLSKEQLEVALQEIGEVDTFLRGQVSLPERHERRAITPQPAWEGRYALGDMVATREAYGHALVRIFPKFPTMVVMDAEVGNSTYSELFEQAYKEEFFQMYIAEQNMVGVALGFSRRGKTPFISTFATFFSRAYDQIRMTEYSDGNIKFAGSHAGVSIGEDGPSQMGLNDIAMFRGVSECIVLYPADGVSTDRLVEEAARHRGNVYLRLTRQATPVLYKDSEEFPIGGSKVLRESPGDAVTIVSAGITLHEALAAYEVLLTEGITVRIIDLYSIVPIDKDTLQTAAGETKAVITVEDHVDVGGLGDAVRQVLADSGTPVYSLAVGKQPMSGKSRELLDYEGISAAAITQKVRWLRG